MKTLKFSYKYKIGQIVYFMYKNEIRRGIVARISITFESKRLATYLTKRIVDKVITIFDNEYPFTQRKIYSLDLVSKNGDFESSPHILAENEIYETKNDLVKALS